MTQRTEIVFDGRIIRSLDGRLLLTAPPDTDLVLGGFDPGGGRFVCGLSRYEAGNSVVVVSYADGTVQHELRLPFGWYIDGKEPPKWCLDGRGLVIAVLGDPDSKGAVPMDSQSFYLWTLDDGRLRRLLGQGHSYHSKFAVEGNSLRYVPRPDETATVPIDLSGKEVPLRGRDEQRK